MFRKKTLAIVLAVMVAATVAVGFVGCKKKSSSGSSSSRQRGGFNMEDMEQRYKSGLAELVTAGTITQAQSDKIYSALTERFANMSGGGSRPAGSGYGGGAGSRGGSPSGSMPSRSTPQGGSEGNRGGGFGSEMLKSLVDDGTITQSQADAVIQKLMGDRGGASGSQSGASSASSSASK